MKQSLKTLRVCLNTIYEEKDGTTFLIQGALGVGKTALLHKLSEVAKKKKWKTVDLIPSALWEPEDLLHCPGKKKGKMAGFNESVGLGADGIGHANVGINVKRVTTTMLRVLQDGKTPIVFVLDEAQMLGLKQAVPPEVTAVLASVLGHIRNGKLGRSAMLLSAGLGTSGRAFRSLGISRFARKCIVQLGALNKESERAVIRDWLTKHAKEESNLTSESDPTLWIDAIAREAHGWPQHIISYVEPAIDYLNSNNHQMTDEGLGFVLERGAESQQEYYDFRAGGISRKERQLLADIFAGIPRDGAIDKEDIMSELMQEHSEEKVDELFDTILQKGIIDERKDGSYGIPIPSMHTRLLSEYGRVKPQQVDKTTDKEGTAKDSRNRGKFHKSRLTREIVVSKSHVFI